jgi:hypothetical protein
MERFLNHFHPEYPVAPAAPGEMERCQRRLGAVLPPPLRELLQACNGGYFRGGLLHLMGAARALRHEDLATWNQPHDWKAAFAHHTLQHYVFFADDAFGNQFGYRAEEEGTGTSDPEVWRFDIQVGEFSRVAPAVSTFFDQVLVDDGEWLLGGDYLQAYRNQGCTFQPGQHLSMTIPSLLGGAFDPENLRPVDPATNLYLAGQVLTQLKPLPAGTEIRGLWFDAGSRRLHFQTIP